MLDQSGIKGRLGSAMRRFGNDESATTAIEYGLIAAIVGVGIILALGGVRTELSDTFTMITGKFAPFIT